MTPEHLQEQPDVQVRPPVVHIQRILPEILEVVWDPVRPLLQKAVDRERGRFTVDHILYWILGRTHQLWVAVIDGRMEAAIISEVLLQPSGKRSCCIQLAGGARVEDWLVPLVEAFVKFGREQGVDEFRVTGRKGWERLLARHSFVLDSVILIREGGR
ncbi:MAG TPA: hypothetical protein VH157_07100 [Bryobacteraceae bacterium]|jgi:hypothetical protein|nr:hypothetical protein [Bryobacteraceae bacterium]